MTGPILSENAILFLAHGLQIKRTMKSNTYLLSKIILIACINIPVSLQIVNGNDTVRITISISDVDSKNNESGKSDTARAKKSTFAKNGKCRPVEKKTKRFNYAYGIENKPETASPAISTGNLSSGPQHRASFLIPSCNGIRAPPSMT